MSILAELRRRNVIRVAILYAVSAWLMLQVADVLAGLFSLPDWTLRFVGFVLLLGLLPALVFSWVYEFTPEGIKRESEITPEESITAHTGSRLNLAIGVLLAVAVTLLGVQTFGPVRPRLQPPANAGAQVPEGSPAGAARPSASAAPSPAAAGDTDDRRSIAVLPFVNMSLAAENEVFSDGISEEILNVLARIPELKVAARTSSFQFKGQSLDVGEIGDALGVDHILEGSVRRAGDRVRVTAQLIQASDGFHLWSESFDRDLTDIFAIQDEIAAAIAGALKTTLKLGAAPERTNLTGTTSLEAYESYLEGMQQWHLRTAESLLRSQSLFERAIEIDPGFAKAHAGLGLTLAVIAAYLIADDRPYHLAADAAARRAIELDPSNAEAYAVLGQVALPSDADAFFERAIELKPSFATAYQWRGSLAQAIGELERARDLMDRAYELDPRSRIIGTNLAWTYWAMDRYEEALAVLAEVERYAPDYSEMLETRFMISAFMGDLEGARRSATALARALGKSADGVSLYVALLDDRRSDEERLEILSWPPDSRRDPASPVLIYDYDLILLLARSGYFEDAARVLRPLVERSPNDASFILSKRSLADFYCRPTIRTLYASAGFPVACGDSQP